MYLKHTSSATKHVKYGTSGWSPESVAKLTNASLKRTESGLLIVSSVILSKYICKDTRIASISKTKKLICRKNGEAEKHMNQPIIIKS